METSANGGMDVPVVAVPHSVRSVDQTAAAKVSTMSNADSVRLRRAVAALALVVCTGVAVLAVGRGQFYAASVWPTIGTSVPVMRLVHAERSGSTEYAGLRAWVERDKSEKVEPYHVAVRDCPSRVRVAAAYATRSSATMPSVTGVHSAVNGAPTS